MEKILVVDDERDICKAIEIYLKVENYQVKSVYDGQQALELMEQEDFDLLLVDIMMPRINGIELISIVRETKTVPIIILSAKGELDDKVRGLNIGADDYITKPFDAVELLARVKSCLRRSKLNNSDKKKESLYRSKRIQLDDDTKQVSVDGEIVRVTPYEYGILLVLLKNKGRVISSEEIYENVWDAPAYDIKKIVSVHISRLRNKIEINPRKPDQLKSVYGMGYIIED